MPSSGDQLLLGSFTYDPSAASHIQTFQIDPSIVELGIDTGVVIFRVTSNWGGEFTCLYRVSAVGRSPEVELRLTYCPQVRVHGEPAGEV